MKKENINLSDEELENISAGANRVVVKFDIAENCKYFEPKPGTSERLCDNCTYIYVEAAGCFGKATTYHCTKNV
ncbi:MAG: hypothetical protein LBM59_07700 [Ruminococcus sp.]|nr:hypothetical protein [Ruminococcus sp.]